MVPRRTTQDQTKRMKLTKLSNGSWVDMTTVTAIRSLPTARGRHRARVIVEHGKHGLEILTANDDEHAQAMADELAGITNGSANTGNDQALRARSDS